MEQKEKAGLKKCERIHKESLIQQIFTGTNKSFSAYPIRVVVMQINRRLVDAPVSIMVSVPKRRFKHAVDRNRIKRVLREAYRLNKQIVWQAVREYNRRTLEEAGPDAIDDVEEKALLIAFLWQGDKHLPYAQVEERVVNLLRRISDKLYLENRKIENSNGEKNTDRA